MKLQQCVRCKRPITWMWLLWVKVIAPATGSRKCVNSKCFEITLLFLLAFCLYVYLGFLFFFQYVLTQTMCKFISELGICQHWSIFSIKRQFTKDAVWNRPCSLCHRHVVTKPIKVQTGFSINCDANQGALKRYTLWNKCYFLKTHWEQLFAPFY